MTGPNLKVHYFKDDTSWGKTKTIEIIASDLGSGLAKKPYSYDGGKTWMSSNKRTYNKEDEVVNIVVKDRVGNKSSQTFKLDKVDVTGPDKPSITNPTNGNWVNYDFALTVSSSDRRSGLGDWYYSYDNNNWTKYNNSTGKSPFTTTNFTKERNQEVYIRACDKLGNCSPSSTYIRIDKTKPTCVSSGGSTSWTNSSRTLIGTCSDTASRCKGNVSRYIDWEGDWSNLSPGTVSDNAGNSTVCPANQTVRIDKTKPTCESSKSNTNSTSGVTATFTCKDTGGSGVVSCTSTKTGLKQSGSYTIKDKAGNSGTCSVTVSSKTQYTKRSCNIYYANEGVCGCYLYNSCNACYNNCLTQSSSWICPSGTNVAYGNCFRYTAYTWTTIKEFSNSAGHNNAKKDCNDAKKKKTGGTYRCQPSQIFGITTYKLQKRGCPSGYSVGWDNCYQQVPKVEQKTCNGGYYPCRDKSCGCASVVRCEQAGCENWGSWSGWSDSASNYCANSNSCQGNTRVIYY